MVNAGATFIVEPILNVLALVFIKVSTTLPIDEMIGIDTAAVSELVTVTPAVAPLKPYTLIGALPVNVTFVNAVSLSPVVAETLFATPGNTPRVKVPLPVLLAILVTVPVIVSVTICIPPVPLIDKDDNAEPVNVVITGAMVFVFVSVIVNTEELSFKAGIVKIPDPAKVRLVKL